MLSWRREIEASASNANTGHCCRIQIQRQQGHKAATCSRNMSHYSSRPSAHKATAMIYHDHMTTTKDITKTLQAL